MFFIQLSIQILAPNLKETLAGLARALLALVEELERALLRLVARREEVLDRLLAKHHLAAAYDTSMLIENKILLCETTACVNSSSVENLSL